MRLLPITTILLPLMVCLLACQPQTEEAADDLLQYVDPFIGTADHGHVYPGASVPFGAVQLSPDNGTQGWDWCAGYNYADNVIVGFSHTHLSGTGIGDLCDISMMPAIATVDFNTQPEDPKTAAYAARFQHANESAEPGYYSVQLDNGVKVELTAASHAGVQRYTFPEGGQKFVLLDLGFAINWDAPVETSIHMQEKGKSFTGYRYSTGWAKDQRVHFAFDFSVPATGITVADSTVLLTETTVRGKKLRMLFLFPPETTELIVKTGISSADEQGARAALATVADKDFDLVKADAQESWQQELAKVQVQTQDETLKKIFYTALYRTCLAPVVYSDPNGNYKACDGNIHKANGYNRYDIFSLWDTFRAANPLYTITQPDKVNDFVRSMLAHYEEYGLLPVWSLLGNETNTMTGYHAIPVIADAYLKGYRDYDAELAFEAMKASAMQDIRGTNFYREYGYIPYDKDGQSVTKTLEYAFDDWCIAQMAKALGKTEDYDTFMKRAQSYQQLYDPSTGFMRAKLSNGEWKAPFDPQFSDHNFDVAEYTEGNAWQHSWFVPQDVKGLIELHGGNAPFITKLDSLFTVSSEITGENASADISGLIGQYAHGNEPSHHIAYLYAYAGAHWKTEERVRNILETQYNAQANGLCGNEDCGQMSAWYVFSAMGFYPVNPASGIYVLGSPMFEKVRIPVGGDKAFELTAKNYGQPFIQSATLNGQPLGHPYLTHAQLMEGAKLELVMGPEPNKALWEQGMFEE
ncbi:MAG: GH92 family glycosyl hydrolase [Phaeodactylibacter sp.]|nr:GH92 family glycosyl hydrolase [Phaeodactylibacter sp.]MCB9300433.1 glycoside hydrolase family 92 protein [Lewinellaceae bacterium]